QPAGRQPGPITSLQSGVTTLGRQRDLAGSPHHPQRLAGYRPQAADSARIFLLRGRLLLLLRPLLRRAVHRSLEAGRPAVLSGPPGSYSAGRTGTRRLLVGLSALQLSAVLGHADGAHGPEAV